MSPVRCLLIAFVAGCGGPDVYSPCEAPADCDVPDEAVAVCLDKSGEGFCSWECGVDDDCDYAPEGEDDRWARVCASFESEDGNFCFPSCNEEGETTGDETADEDDVCPSGFTCRSTGGGNDNRKVCFPDEV